MYIITYVDLYVEFLAYTTSCLMTVYICIYYNFTFIIIRPHRSK